MMMIYIYYNKHVEITTSKLKRTITFYLATFHRTTTTNSYANISTIFVLHSTYSTYCTKTNNNKYQNYFKLCALFMIFGRNFENTLTYAKCKKYTNMLKILGVGHKTLEKFRYEGRRRHFAGR